MLESTGPTKKQPVTCKVALTAGECNMIALALHYTGMNTKEEFEANLYLNLYARLRAISVSFSGPHGPQDQGGL